MDGKWRLRVLVLAILSMVASAVTVGVEPGLRHAQALDGAPAVLTSCGTPSFSSWNAISANPDGAFFPIASAGVVGSDVIRGLRNECAWNGSYQYTWHCEDVPGGQNCAWVTTEIPPQLIAGAARRRTGRPAWRSVAANRQRHQHRDDACVAAARHRPHARADRPAASLPPHSGGDALKQGRKSPERIRRFPDWPGPMATRRGLRKRLQFHLDKHTFDVQTPQRGATYRQGENVKLSRLHRVALIGAVLAVGLAACGSDDKESTGSTPAGGGGDFTNGGLTIAMITHETPGDTYWDIVKAGANEAAKAHNITLKYSSDPDFTKQAVLVQNAIDSGVDGIAMTAAGPSALGDVVKAANAAKIPVVMFDSGIDDWKALGAMMYFGSDEYLGGVALGDRIGAAGGKHILCVIHQEGSVALEARCKGVKESKGGATSENMQVNGSDDASVNASITAKLQQDPSIDWIVTMGAPVALVTLESIKTAGTSTQVATFDLNVAAAKAIKDGTIAMAVDAQPYAQGYEAVDSLWLYNTNGNDLGGGQSVLTGPSIVDSSNIDKVLPFAEGGTR